MGQRQVAHDALARYREELDSIERLARVGTWTADAEAAEFHGACAFLALLGLDPAPGPVARERLLARLHHEDRAGLEDGLRKCGEPGAAFSVVTRIAGRDGGERVLHWLGEVPTGVDDPARGLRGVLQDVTDRGHSARRPADQDGLTGLSGRRDFMRRLTGAIDRARRHGRSLAVLVLDLDDFKRVNENYGHGRGDFVLGQFAERLERCLRQTDLVCRGDGEADGPATDPSVSRLAGDAFTVLLNEVRHPQDAARVADRILDALREPFDVAGVDVILGASIGITIFPEDGPDADTLLGRAETALRQAKDESRNRYRFFTARVDARATRRLELERRLCRAFENHELRVYYQPQVHLRSGLVTGAEALLRWEDPHFGVVAPDEFIAIAEEAGLIQPIGEWVLRAACWQARRWQDDGLPDLRMAVNVSPHHFDDDHLVEAVNRILWDTGLEPGRIELEITENVLLRDEEMVLGILRRLKAIGIALALDDFGTGYASLSYLKRFPIDAVKIDRTFVREIPIDRDDEAITAAILSMSRALRLRVVAEGVETEKQLEFLRVRGCDEIQGYLVSPPVEAAAVEALVRRGRCL